MESSDNSYSDYSEFAVPANDWGDDDYLFEDDFPLMSDLQLIPADEIGEVLVMQAMGATLV